MNRREDHSPLHATATIPRSDGILGFALALPALALLVPLSGGLPPLVADPSPEATAAAWLAISALPALALLLLRGGAARTPAALALLVTWLVATAGLGGASDTFHADRMGLTLAAGAALVVAGGSLQARGRAVLCLFFALLGLTLVLTARSAPQAFGLALAGPATWTGLVGNTGDLSEAALPAGILGLGVFLHGPRVLRPLGLAAALAHAAYAGLVPVHAGTVGWLAVSAFAFACGRARPDARRLARLALIAALVAVVTAAGRSLTGPAEATSTTRDSAPASAESPGGAAGPAEPSAAEGRGGPPSLPASEALARAELGGAPFRWATWRATSAMVAAHPLGVGAGQFQAAFPPYRDQAELVASSHGRREPTPQEVEHPHNDVLLALAELGLIGGGAFGVFLALVLGRAISALRGSDAVRGAFGLAAVGLITNSLFNAPLLDGTLSGALAWPIFGVVLAPRRGPAQQEPDLQGQGARVQRFVPLLFALLLGLQVRTAWSLIEHGRALSEVPAARVVADGRDSIDGALLEPILARALRARPDSVVALEKRHELLLARGAPAAERRQLLERVLARRPHSFSAQLSLGNLEARSGDLAAAGAAYALAAEVDPGHPALLRNRLLLALDQRDVAATRLAMANARAGGVLDSADLERLAAQRMLSGHLEVARALLEAWAPDQPPPSEPDAEDGDVRYDPLDPNDAFRANRSLRAIGREALADGFLCAFQLVMARDHRATGSFGDALAMGRQALRRRDAWPQLGATDGALRLELAATQVAAGDPERARATLTEDEISLADLRHLGESDLSLLIEAGLVAVQAGRFVVPEGAPEGAPEASSKEETTRPTGR